MRLTKLSAFRRIVYTPGSAPTMNTLRARIGAGALPGGCKVDGHYYVDLDVFEGKASASEDTDRRAERAAIVAKLTTLNKNPLLAGLVEWPKKR